MASGYRYCACRDCTEIIVGEEGAFCSGCKEAGCPDYQGQEGMSQECQRADAYDLDQTIPDKRRELFDPDEVNHSTREISKLIAEDFYKDDGLASGPLGRN